MAAAACAGSPASPATDTDAVGPPPLHAVRTASGVAYEIRSAGDGARPSAWDAVQVRYVAWTSDGAELERAEDPPLIVEPRAWAEPLRVLGVGARARLWIPRDVAGFEVEPAGDLIVDVEVSSIIDRPAPPAIPTRAPEAAVAMRSGTRKLVLAAPAAESLASPEPADGVSFHYTAIDAGGGVVSSTIPPARPIDASVQAFPPVVVEALLTMREGERSQFWSDDETWAWGFEIELLAVEPRAAAPRLSADLLTPPFDVATTPSGTPYRLVRAARDGERATSRAGVAYRFKAWDPNGRLVAMSGSEPIRTRLPFVSDALRDAITQMRPGEIAQFWFERSDLDDQVDRLGRLQANDRVIYEIELVAVKPPRERATPTLSARAVIATAGTAQETP